jgi:anthranilate phosphoribosyltransferase
MKHVAPVRKELGFRTVFNLLGPLCNPARVRRQLLGVFAERWVEPVAGVLAELGTEHAWVVNGMDGMDELTTTTKSTVVELKDGKLRRFEIAPDDVGLERTTIEELKGGDAKYNADMLMLLLEGEGLRSYNRVVVLNAAAALVVAGRAGNLQEGAAVATQAIQSGRALEVFNNLFSVTKRLAG